MRQPGCTPLLSQPANAASADCRCLCGSLLARVVGGQVELKCRRCKRTLLVPLSDATTAEAPERAAAVRQAV